MEFDKFHQDSELEPYTAKGRNLQPDSDRYMETLTLSQGPTRWFCQHREGPKSTAEWQIDGNTDAALSFC